MKKIKKRYSHLSSKDRLIIEEELNQGTSFKNIASIINKHPSAISREVRRNFSVIRPSNFNNAFNKCDKRGSCKLKNICNSNCSKLCKTCEKCNDNCIEFTPEHLCQHFSKPPYVCNGCSNRKSCRKTKYVYKSAEADKIYNDTLSSSRQGINISDEELSNLAKIIVPCIKKGHSIAAILMNNPDINISEKTLYNYIEQGCFSEIKNVDLRRKVKCKPRSKNLNKDENSNMLKTKNRVGRTYEDFLNYLKEHPNANIVEIDTVEGIKGGKSLLTIFFRNCKFMIAFLIDSQSKKEVNSKFDIIKKIWGNDFLSQFEVILTDNGKEFQDPDYIENFNNDKHIHLFYCDSGKSYQKAGIEKNHEFIRYVLPKGVAFDNLTQGDINILMSNINSYPREDLNKCCPFDLATLLIGKKFIDDLKYFKIDGNSLNLTPNLLKKY